MNTEVVLIPATILAVWWVIKLVRGVVKFILAGILALSCLAFLVFYVPESKVAMFATETVASTIMLDPKGEYEYRELIDHYDSLDSAKFSGALGFILGRVSKAASSIKIDTLELKDAIIEFYPNDKGIEVFVYKN